MFRSSSFYSWGVSSDAVKKGPAVGKVMCRGMTETLYSSTNHLGRSAVLFGNQANVWHRYSLFLQHIRSSLFLSYPFNT